MVSVGVFVVLLLTVAMIAVPVFGVSWFVLHTLSSIRTLKAQVTELRRRTE